MLHSDTLALTVELWGSIAVIPVKAHISQIKCTIISGSLSSSCTQGIRWLRLSAVQTLGEENQHWGPE